MRVCSVCGGEEFTLDTWECVTCPQRIQEEWEVGERDATGIAPDGAAPDSPGEGEPEDSPGEGEGEGGEGEPPPPQEDQLIVLTPGETIQLPDGTLAIVSLAPKDFILRAGIATRGGENWLLCIRLIDGAVCARMKDITQRERIDATAVEAGDFIFEGAKQEIVADTFSPTILDGCEYTIVSLEDGSVHGLTVEQAQEVEKVKE